MTLILLLRLLTLLLSVCSLFSEFAFFEFMQPFLAEVGGPVDLSKSAAPKKSTQRK